MKNNLVTQETKNEWHRDPNQWRFGIFYYNPLDNRIFAPKRIKSLGWTINFANRRSIFFNITLIAFILFLIYLYQTNL